MRKSASMTAKRDVSSNMNVEIKIPTVIIFVVLVMYYIQRKSKNEL